VRAREHGSRSRHCSRTGICDCRADLAGLVSVAFSMTLWSALAGVGRVGVLPIDSSDYLQDLVDSHPRSLAGSLVGDPLLEPWFRLRALEVLLELARATPFSAEEPVRTIRQMWSVLKYLGMFEPPDPEIRLSESTRMVRGNARRLFSEELGVGFARSVARQYVTAHHPTLTSVRIEDVDHIEPDSPLAESLEFESKQRPDYFLIASNPLQPIAFQIFVLEAKGSMSRSTSIGQLAKASRQVRSVTVDGYTPAGLACSTILSEVEVTACALQLSDDFGFAAAAPVHTRVDPEGIRDYSESVEGVRSSQRSGQGTVATSLISSWMRLGRFAGDDEVELAWRSSLREEFLAPYRPTGSPRVQVEIDGEAASGRMSIIDTPEGRAEVFLGVNESVLDALRTNESGAVLQAQAEFASRQGGRQSLPESETEVSAVDPEGAVARISLVG
jgi:hypothetical protein